MRAEFRQGQGNAVILYLDAESELESIALAAWERQVTPNPHGFRADQSLSMRYVITKEYAE